MNPIGCICMSWCNGISSWWLNQPTWKIRASQIGSFSQVEVNIKKTPPRFFGRYSLGSPLKNHWFPLVRKASEPPILNGILMAPNSLPSPSLLPSPVLGRFQAQQAATNDGRTAAGRARAGDDGILKEAMGRFSSMCQGRSTPCVGDKLIPYYWVDDHALTQETTVI